MYTELLRLCGFEDAEIEKEGPRIDKAFQKLEIGPEDCKRAEDRVKKYFSLDLVGVRKCLGLGLKELIDLVLAKEEGKKLVYTSVPPPAGLCLSLNMAGVWCQVPESVLALGIGQIFGKLAPIMEAAEEHGLPPAVAACGYHQVRLGGMAKGIIPLPDAVISSGFFCDQSPKVYELIHEVYGVHIVELDGCVDSNWGEWPEIPERRVRLYAEDIKEAAEELERVLGIELTEETLMAGWRKYTDMRLSAQRVIELSKAEPMPISHVDLNPFWRLISSAGGRGLEEGLEVIDVFTKEVEKRVEEGKGVVEKGAPSVAFLVNSVTDPATVRMFEECGLAMRGPLVYYMPPLQRAESKFTPLEERTVEAMMRRGLYHSTPGCIAVLEESIKAMNPDALLWYYHFSCRASSPQALIIKKSIENDLGIPVLLLEGDVFDERSYTAEVLRTRVEAFADMLRERKAAKVG
jgi:benzoyl-CoA reductase/2-hydroxyglutaryl-CoA dehydratase subunit BcrC/BadD/HgdB